MYYDDPGPWYKDYNIIFMLLIVAVLVIGFLTGDVRPECLRKDCRNEARQR